MPDGHRWPDVGFVAGGSLCGLPEAGRAGTLLPSPALTLVQLAAEGGSVVRVDQLEDALVDEIRLERHNGEESLGHLAGTNPCPV